MILPTWAPVNADSGGVVRSFMSTHPEPLWNPTAPAAWPAASFIRRGQHGVNPDG